MSDESDPPISGAGEDRRYKVTPTPAPGEDRRWYVPETKPQPMSAEALAEHRRALGLDKRAHSNGSQSSSARWYDESIEDIRAWTSYYTWRSLSIGKLGPVANVGRVMGRHGPHDWLPDSADGECQHGRLPGDPCPQPLLRAESNAPPSRVNMAPPEQLWPYDRPCWCFGEEDALPAPVAEPAAAPKEADATPSGATLSHDAWGRPVGSVENVEKGCENGRKR
jgi:hypothetical protein